LIKENFVAFTIFDTRSDQFLVFKKSEGYFNFANGSGINYLKQFFIENEELQLIYKSIKIAVFTPHFTFVPNEFLDPENELLYLKFHFSNLEEQYFVRNNIPLADASVLFFIPENLILFLKNQFNDPVVQHTSAYLLQNLSEKNTAQEENKVFISIHNDLLEIAVFKKGRWEFYNTFFFKTSEDFIYYILLTFNQLGLNPEDDTLVLLGEIEKQSNLYQALFKYVNHIKFSNRPEYRSFAPAFDSIPDHYYYHLFCM